MRYVSPDGTGHFELNPFPGNNQIVVSNHAFVKPEFRGNGYGTDAARERLRLARELGYDFMLSTVRLDNPPQLKIMSKLGWEQLASFKNTVTEAGIVLFGYDLSLYAEKESESCGD